MDKLDAALRFSQQALSMRAYRQEVISSNIANADTPGYKARDFDFNSALTQAVERGASLAQASQSSVSTRRDLRLLRPAYFRFALCTSREQQHQTQLDCAFHGYVFEFQQAARLDQ